MPLANHVSISVNVKKPSLLLYILTALGFEYRHVQCGINNEINPNNTDALLSH